MFDLVININCRQLRDIIAQQRDERYILYEITDNDFIDSISE